MRMQRRRTPKSLSPAIVLSAFAIALAACGDAAVDASTTSLVEEPTTSTVVATEDSTPQTPADGQPWEQGLPGEAPAGTIRLPILGGIEFETTEPHFVAPMPIGDPFEITLELVGDLNGWIDIFAQSESTPEEIIDTLADADMSLGEVKEVTVGSFEAKAVDYDDAPYDFEPVVGAWFPANAGRIWVIDTERGTLVVAASASDEAGEDRPETVARAINVAEQILRTLSLVETATTPTTQAQADTTTPEGSSPSPTVSGEGVTIEAAPGNTHIDVLSNDDDLTNTWRVLTAGGGNLPDVLAFPDDNLTKTTFLAPIDDAWLALAESRSTTFDALLLSDVGYFGFVLGYHTFSEIILPDDLTDTSPGEYQVETATGIPLTVVVDERRVTGFVDQHGTMASVVERVEVDKGVIYAINAVLIPPGDE